MWPLLGPFSWLPDGREHTNTVRRTWTRDAGHASAAYIQEAPCRDCPARGRRRDPGV